MRVWGRNEGRGDRLWNQFGAAAGRRGHGRWGLVDLDRRLILTRLGQGVDATGRFHPDALARTLDAFAEYAAVLAGFGVDRVRLVATSAARDASNREDFFSGARARLGVDPEIISGDEEAGLSFLGALTALPNVAAPALVMDIGGGSTELIVGSGADRAGAPRVDHGLSLDIGSVRIRNATWPPIRPVPSRLPPRAPTSTPCWTAPASTSPPLRPGSASGHGHLAVGAQPTPAGL